MDCSAILKYTFETHKLSNKKEIQLDFLANGKFECMFLTGPVCISHNLWSATNPMYFVAQHKNVCFGGVFFVVAFFLLNRL